MKPDETLSYARKRFVGDLGLTDEQFYGVMGSVMGESGRALNSKAHNPNDPHGGANGIFQHVGPRWNGLVKFAESRGADPYDARTQIDYVAEVELQGPEGKALRAVKATDNRVDASRAWTDTFERPNQKYANHELRAEHSDYVAGRFNAGEVPQYNGETSILTASSMNADSGNGTHPTMILGQLGESLLAGPAGNSGFQVGQKATPLQQLAMLAGSYVDPEMGSKFMLDLFGGPGVEGADLSVGESLAMAIGGYFGGVPGAMAGAGIQSAIKELLSPTAATDPEAAATKGLVPGAAPAPVATPAREDMTTTAETATSPRPKANPGPKVIGSAAAAAAKPATPPKAPSAMSTAGGALAGVGGTVGAVGGVLQVLSGLQSMFAGPK